MKIQQIQPNTSFEAKQRFLNKNQMADVKTLLTKMNSEAVCYKSDDIFFSSTIAKKLCIGKDVEFIDDRGLRKPVSEDKQMVKQTLFTIGKTELVIDNESGEILDYNKPFFKTWKSIMNQISHYLKMLKENYENPDVVKVVDISINGMTEYGYSLYKKALAEVEKEYLKKRGKKSWSD